MSIKPEVAQELKPTESRERELRECIDACMVCHKKCLKAASKSFDKSRGNIEELPIRLLLDCAQISKTAAEFMVRGSSVQDRVCALCAEISLLCAKSCEAFPKDALLRESAAVCRRLVSVCRGICASVGT